MRQVVTDQCPTRPKYASMWDPWDRSVICGAALEAWHPAWGVVRLLWETPAEQTSPPDQDRAPGVDSNPYPYVLIGAKMATHATRSSLKSFCFLTCSLTFDMK